MKKMLKLIVFIFVLVLFFGNINTFAYSYFPDPPVIYTTKFKNADELRKHIIKTRGTDDEEVFIQKIHDLPFVTVKDNVTVDESLFCYRIRADVYEESWSMSYTIGGIVYKFEYLFHNKDGSNNYFPPSIVVKLDGYEKILRLYNDDNKLYKGKIKCEDIVLNLTVSTGNAEDIDMSCFNLGELSLELDSDRTTEATTAVTTETPSASTTLKEEPSNSTVKNTFIVIGIVIITAAVSSALTVIIIRRRRE